MTTPERIVELASALANSLTVDPPRHSLYQGQFIWSISILWPGVTINNGFSIVTRTSNIKIEPSSFLLHMKNGIG